MKKYILMLIVTLSLCEVSVLAHGGAGFKAKFEKITLEEKTIKAIDLKTQKIEEKDIFETIKSTGQIEEIPNNHFDINSPVQGTVASVLVDLGSKVRVGTPVATIESPEISRLQAEIEKLKADFEYATSNFEREKSLFEDGISSKKDFDASKAGLKGTEAKLKAAESNLEILTRLATQSEQGKFNILSRKNGTIVERSITVGEVVSPSKLLFHGIDLSTVWASANIYEKDLRKVSLGQIAYITLDGIPNKVYKGKIVYIGSVLVEKSRTLPVKVKLDNSKGELNPGAFIKLAIHTKNKKKSITIPITALVDIEADKDTKGDTHKHIVYVRKENTFIPKEVEVATHDSNSVEVLSGLKKEDEVVTSGGYQLQFAEGGHDEHGHEGEGGHDDEDGHDHGMDNHEHDSDEMSEHSHEGHDHEKVKPKASDKNQFGLILLLLAAVIFGLILGIFMGKRKNK